MNEMQVKAVIAGIFFGIWPLFMNRSGLNGNVSSLFYGAAALIGILPFALYSNGFAIPVANWTMVVCAGAFGAIGLLLFTGVLSTATPQNIGTLFVLVNVMQVVVAGTYQAYMSGHLATDKGLGYLAAALAAYLLLR